MTQMDICCLKVDNRLGTALIGLCAMVTLLGALKAWSLDEHKNCLCPKEKEGKKKPLMNKLIFERIIYMNIQTYRISYDLDFWRLQLLIARGAQFYFPKNVFY